MAVHIDRISTGVLRDGPDGFEQTIVYRVTGVRGDEYTRRLNALLASGIPAKGARHRALPQMRVMDRAVQAVGNTTSTFDVVVQFAEPRAADAEQIDRTKRFGPITWRGAGRSITRQTNVDVNGRPLAVFYAGVPRLDTIDATTGTVSTENFGTYVRLADIKTATVDDSLLAFSASRWERANPESKARTFGNKVNRDQWRGYPPLSVLAKVITWDPDPESGYRVTYDFVYSPDRWLFEAAVTIGSQVPQDATIGNGIERYHVYERVSFARLGLT